MGRESNPREVREANARFAYEVRNKGALAAIDNMHARNASRREEDRREAKQAAAKILYEKAEKELRSMKRTAFNQFSD